MLIHSLLSNEVSCRVAIRNIILFWMTRPCIEWKIFVVFVEKTLSCTVCRLKTVSKVWSGFAGTYLFHFGIPFVCFLGDVSLATHEALIIGRSQLIRSLQHISSIVYLLEPNPFVTRLYFVGLGLYFTLAVYLTLVEVKGVNFKYVSP